MHSPVVSDQQDQETTPEDCELQVYLASLEPSSLLEASIKINGKKLTALIDSGASCSLVREGFCGRGCDFRLAVS